MKRADSSGTERSNRRRGGWVRANELVWGKLNWFRGMDERGVGGGGWWYSGRWRKSHSRAAFPRWQMHLPKRCGRFWLVLRRHAACRYYSAFLFSDCYRSSLFQNSSVILSSRNNRGIYRRTPLPMNNSKSGVAFSFLSSFSLARANRRIKHSVSLEIFLRERGEFVSWYTLIRLSRLEDRLGQVMLKAINSRRTEIEWISFEDFKLNRR